MVTEKYAEELRELAETLVTPERFGNTEGEPWEQDQVYEYLAYIATVREPIFYNLEEQK